MVELNNKIFFKNHLKEALTKVLLGLSLFMLSDCSPETKEEKIILGDTNKVFLLSEQIEDIEFVPLISEMILNSIPTKIEISDDYIYYLQELYGGSFAILQFDLKGKLVNTKYDDPKDPLLFVNDMNCRNDILYILYEDKIKLINAKTLESLNKTIYLPDYYERMELLDSILICFSSQNGLITLNESGEIVSNHDNLLENRPIMNDAFEHLTHLSSQNMVLVSTNFNSKLHSINDKGELGVYKNIDIGSSSVTKGELRQMLHAGSEMQNIVTNLTDKQGKMLYYSNVLPVDDQLLLTWRMAHKFNILKLFANEKYSHYQEVYNDTSLPFLSTNGYLNIVASHKDKLVILLDPDYIAASKVNTSNANDPIATKWRIATEKNRIDNPVLAFLRISINY